MTHITSTGAQSRGRYASLKLRIAALSAGLAYVTGAALGAGTALAEDGYQRPVPAGGALYEELADQQVGYVADEPNVRLGGRVVLCRNGLAIYYEFESRDGPYGTTSKSAHSVGVIEALEDGGNNLVARVRFILSDRPAKKQQFSARFAIQGPKSTMLIQTTQGLILDQGNTIMGTIQGKLDASAECATARRNLPGR